jgi:hypothetical protein
MLGWRRGIIYAYTTTDPYTGKRVRWSYVGLTRQELIKRHNQHMGLDPRQKRQPWSDLYPEVRIVFDFSSCPDWWLSLVEKLTIKWTKPLYNYIHNKNNPRRITKYQAEADRQARDLRKNFRVW